MQHRSTATGTSRRTAVNSLATLGLSMLGIVRLVPEASADSRLKCGKSCPCRRNESKGKCRKRCQRKCDW